MNGVALTLGPLEAQGSKVLRSGVRWLYEDGHLCRPGEVIAYCNITVTPNGRRVKRGDAFATEMRDFQVAFAPRIGGRLKKSQTGSQGGFTDLLAHSIAWMPDFVIGHIEQTPEDRAINPAGEPLELLFLAGRRTTELAEDRSGLQTGWHDRSRAWWGNGGRYPTILSLGICEQLGVVRGDRFAFLEFFDAMAGPAHVVYIPDDLLVPCARIALEGFTRTEAGFQEIADDFARTMFADAAATRPKDWMFAATLLSALKASPLTETYDLLGPGGLERSTPPEAVILSLNSETTATLRHKRLGYSILCHRYRLRDSGPRVQEWLRTHFEPVRRSVADIYRDYSELIEAVRAKSDVKFLILNVLSSLGSEDILSYAACEAPLGHTLTTVRSKELNLMLHDLVRHYGICIVDADAITAELGAAQHLRDGIHGSGAWQSEVRGEILRVLRGLGVGASRGLLRDRERHEQSV